MLQRLSVFKNRYIHFIYFNHTYENMKNPPRNSPADTHANHWKPHDNFIRISLLLSVANRRGGIDRSASIDR